MKKEDFEQFSDLWSGAFDQYGKTATQSGIMIAFRVLYQYEWRQVQNAIIEYLGDENRGKWLIKPAEVVAIIHQGPESAWNEFMYKLGRVGPYQDPVFNDPSVNAGVRALGGWVQCNAMSEDELESRRAEFAAGYADANEHSARPVLGLESKQREEAGELDRVLSNLSKQKRLN